MLAESAGDFFPITAVSEATLERTLLWTSPVDPGIRRMVVDQADRRGVGSVRRRSGSLA
ncbi:MAG: hypothetical protein U0R78_15500 [Nocardioidaceae bacterium]